MPIESSCTVGCGSTCSTGSGLRGGWAGRGRRRGQRCGQREPRHCDGGACTAAALACAAPPNAVGAGWQGRGVE
jgi:hypothetical protein